MATDCVTRVGYAIVHHWRGTFGTWYNAAIGARHSGNVIMKQLDGQVVLFDCIEFNEPFRFTDVYADIAFLAMDLEDRGLRALSSRLISQYLEYTGDYAGLELLNFYKAYRALVRAKVALFSLAHQSDAVQRAASGSESSRWSMRSPWFFWKPSMR